MMKEIYDLYYFGQLHTVTFYRGSLEVSWSKLLCCLDNAMRIYFFSPKSNLEAKRSMPQKQGNWRDINLGWFLSRAGLYHQRVGR